MSLVDLHPSIFRAPPRIDLLHRYGKEKGILIEFFPMFPNYWRTMSFVDVMGCLKHKVITETLLIMVTGKQVLVNRLLDSLLVPHDLCWYKLPE